VRKRRQSLNWLKHSLKGQSGTKSPIKPPWSEQMNVLSTFLESLLNFPHNNLKNTWKFSTISGKEAMSKFEVTETQFEKKIRDKIACKTYLEWENVCFKQIIKILINFIYNPWKILQNFDTVSEKSGVKIWTDRNTVWMDSQGQNRL